MTACKPAKASRQYGERVQVRVVCFGALRWTVLPVLIFLFVRVPCLTAAPDPAVKPKSTPDATDSAPAILPPNTDDLPYEGPAAAPGGPADALAPAPGFRLFPSPRSGSSESEEPDLQDNPAVRKVRSEPRAQPTTSDRVVFTLGQQAQSNGETLFTGIGGVPSPLSARYLSSGYNPQPGFTVGPARVQLSLGTGVTFLKQSGGGIDSESNDVYATISPSINLYLGTPEIGRVLNAQYQGVLSLGQTQSRSNYDQTFQAGGTFNFTKLTLGGSVQVSQLSGGDQDFSGASVNRVLVSLGFNAGYVYSELTTLGFSLNTPLRLYEQGDSSGGVTSQTTLDYAYSPVTTIGAGFGLGTLVVEGNTQVFEQVAVRLRYVPTVRLSFNGSLGGEFRAIDEKEEISPIFKLGGTWEPRDGTTFTLSGERNTYNSAALSGTNYITTSISFTVSQRLGDYLTAQGSAGFNNNEYERASSQVTGGRNSQYFILQVGLTASLGSHLRASLNASYGQLVSSGDDTLKLSILNGVSSRDRLSTETVHTYQTNFQIIYDF